MNEATKQIKRVMVDVETLSSRSDAAIISIGVARFDESGVLDTAGWALKESEVRGHIDPQTIYWWMKKSQAAKGFSFGGEEMAVNAAVGFRSFIEQGCDELWANDPEFDCVIMRHWWDLTTQRQALGPFPVSFRASRSFRTLKALTHGRVDITDCYTGIAHNPIDDAAMQARAVIKMLKVLAP
jgi:3' exoribonuclease, RNase T-like